MTLFITKKDINFLSSYTALLIQAAKTEQTLQGQALLLLAMNLGSKERQS